ncbi:MAG: PIN domain-containing protein [Deltaproteobacteria bacterium]|nr:PIN domain-containing protein [Deltaproteobacteria bacterium]
MIYLDTSVVLAQLLAEDRRPDAALWAGPLVSSRLLEYETWTRLHARKLERTHGDAARELLGRISFLELSPVVLARALEPFPLPVRTLDALHLASALFLRDRRTDVALATFDDRMLATARKLGLRLWSAPSPRPTPPPAPPAARPRSPARPAGRR